MNGISAPGCRGAWRVWQQAHLAHRLLRCCREAHSARDPPNAADLAALRRAPLCCGQRFARAGVCSADGRIPDTSPLMPAAPLPDVEAAPALPEAGDEAAHMLLPVWLQAFTSWLHFTECSPAGSQAVSTKQPSWAPSHELISCAELARVCANTALHANRNAVTPLGSGTFEVALAKGQVGGAIAGLCRLHTCVSFTQHRCKFFGCQAAMPQVCPSRPSPVTCA